MLQKKGQTKKEARRSVNYHFNLGPMTTLTMSLYVSLSLVSISAVPFLLAVHLANKACPQHSECQGIELL